MTWRYIVTDTVCAVFSPHVRSEFVRDLWLAGWLALVDPFQFWPPRRH